MGRASVLHAGGQRFESPTAQACFVEWGRSSAWLERWPVTPEVASSSLVGPAIFFTIASVTMNGGAMGSTVLMRLKLQVELSTSLNGSKKEKQTSYHSQHKIMLPFSFLFPAGK